MNNRVCHTLTLAKDITFKIATSEEDRDAIGQGIQEVTWTFPPLLILYESNDYTLSMFNETPRHLTAAGGDTAHKYFPIVGAASSSSARKEVADG